MIEQLKHSKSRRYFIFIILVLWVAEVLGVILFYNSTIALDSAFFQIVTNILFELIATTLVAAGIAVLYLYVLRSEKQLTDVEILDSEKTITAHKLALRHTDFWFANGHIGRWVRSAAMPYLARKSKQHGVPINIKVIVLDPNNEKLIKQYVTFRGSVVNRDKFENNAEGVMLQVFATLAKAKYFSDSESQIKVEVYLSNEFSIFRTDINSGCVFDTRIDPRLPALQYFNKPELPNLYMAKKMDFEFKQRMCKKLELVEDIKITDLRNYNELKIYFERIGMPAATAENTLKIISELAIYDDEEYI